jgi:hypothetical protein
VRAIDHSLSLCDTLAHAVCPTALVVGDLPLAGRVVSMLLEESICQLRGRHFEGALQIRRRDAASRLWRMRGALDELRQTGSALGNMVFPFTAVEGLAATGQARQGIAAIDERLSQAGRDGRTDAHQG